MSSPEDLRAKISKLTAAIEQHKQTNSYAPSRGRGRAQPMWQPRGRGRGRGTMAPTFGNKKLILNQPGSAPLASTARSNSISSSLQTPSNHTSMLSQSEPTKSGQNRTVVINGVTFVTDASGKKLTRQDLIPSSTASSLMAKLQTTQPSLTTAPVYTPPKAEIEGVEYVRTKGGNLVRAELVKDRLIRKAKLREAKAASKREQAEAAKLLRQEDRKKKKKISRSKGGHMVYVKEPEGYVRQGRHGKSLVLNGNQKDKSKMYCGYFTRYGKCKNGKKCPFKHDRSHRAICPKYLQHKCPQPAHLCLLSHFPIPEIMPHCSHFQRGKCDRVDCPYPHVRVSPQASVCKAFALEGYCAKGENCKNKHIHVCPDFAETGKCENATCKLPHVALKKKQAQKAPTQVRQWVNPQLIHAGSKREHDGGGSDEHTDKKSRAAVNPLDTKEEDGFLKFDDDDEGWSAFKMKDEDVNIDDQLSLHFSDHEDSEDDSDSDEHEGMHDNGVGIDDDVSSDDVSSDDEEQHDEVVGGNLAN
ncbi:hypothetical protein INT44_005354 [Umbelopsis vinacea]|uniref:C3H1-type domain-containing protein n=1 Tax=Umbelopsis vinacea TaxID=44442 RepID=A0A8H7Q716_9FUNG|nr:hypothetical protein INT44_005354 [Umbelopsis vinacea]